MATPVFFSHQVERLFFDEPKQQINTQLARMVKRGDLIRLKRGVYRLAEAEVDELVVASLLYWPSYVSLESALHNLGVLPDVPAQVTSVTPVTVKKIITAEGAFVYQKIKPELFFGFQKIKDEASRMYYNLAFLEKALLDWVYVRKIKSLETMRLDKALIDGSKLKQWSKFYPSWVRKVVR